MLIADDAKPFADQPGAVAGVEQLLRGVRQMPRQ